MELDYITTDQSMINEDLSSRRARMYIHRLTPLISLYLLDAVLC